MANFYKVKWQQNTVVNGSAVTNTYYLDTDNDVFKLNSINSAWNTPSYAGAIPANGSLFGSGSVLSFSGWKKDRVNSDMRDFTISASQTSSQQNLRFMIRFGNGAFQNKQTFKWTAIPTSVADEINESYDDITIKNSVSMYNPYTKSNINISTNGTANSPLCVMPLNNIKINDLIWYPIFIIKEIEYYNYNDTAGGYTSTTGGSVNIPKSWSQIKPEDKTEAGVDYDEELFTTGYKEIPAVNEDGVRFRFVAGVVLVPFYGKCSNTYNPSNDSYTQGTNPDDGLQYQARNVLGSVTSDSGDYPIVGNTTNLNRPNLMVMGEYYNQTTGGIIYATPTGIIFGNATTINSIGQTSFAFQPGYSITSDFHLLSGSPSFTDFWFNNNMQYCGYFKGEEDPTTEDNNPTTYYAGGNADIYGNVSVIDSSYPSSQIYYLQNNSPIAFTYTRSNRNVTLQNLAYFSINELWHTIASLGCYVADSVTTAGNAPLGKYIGNNNHVYLGEMSSSGITTGKMLQGSEIAEQPQADIDDIIQDTPYTPVVPGPGGGGSSDPSSTPTPSGKAEGKITGDGTKGAKQREFGSGSITYYALSLSDAAEFKNLLWAQPKSFYSAIQISGKQNASIFDYVSSYRYYPTDITSLGISLGAASDIHLGTGAIFKQTNGTEYKLQPLSNFYTRFSWCSWSLSAFNGWRNNFLDYSPYCKLSIYLPYAGTFDLDVQTVAAMVDITTATINVDVCIDINTGSLTYYVDANGFLILDKTLKLGIDLPLSGNDAIQQSVAILQANYHNGSQAIGMATNLATSGDALSALTEVAQLPFNVGEMALASSLANRQIPTQVGGFGGTLSTVTMGQDPYITIYRQKVANPDNYGHVVGYLTESKHTIAELSGWTICTNVDLTGIPATSSERSMIAQMLQSGFYA